MSEITESSEKSSKTILLILYILVVVIITGFMTPQYVCFIVIIASLLAILKLRKFSYVNLRIRELMKYALIISIMLGSVSLILFLDALNKEAPQLVALTLITSYISPLPLLTFISIMLSKFIMRNKFLVTLSLILYAIGIIYIPFEVSSGPLLLKELNTSKGIPSLISGEAGMLMSFSAPLSLTLIIISMLIMIALLTKSVREYLRETSLSSSLKS